MIDLATAEMIHRRSIEEFGGAVGLRDKGALEIALARPFQTFDGQDLHATPEAKAAALLEGILIRHPWLDGNKRTGFLLMLFLLARHRLSLEASEEDRYHMVVRVAEGKSNADEIKAWIEARVRPM